MRNVDDSGTVTILINVVDTTQRDLHTTRDQMSKCCSLQYNQIVGITTHTVCKLVNGPRSTNQPTETDERVHGGLCDGAMELLTGLFLKWWMLCASSRMCTCATKQNVCDKTMLNERLKNVDNGMRYLPSVQSVGTP